MHSTVVILASLLYLSQASLIKFSSTPDGVKEGLTGTVTLRCSVEDTAASGSVVGRRDVAQTLSNVAELSSLIIMHNGTDVASVSHANAANIMDGSSNAAATGTVVKSSLENGFVQVTITSPSKAQTGEYQCEANAIGTNGHGFLLSTALDLPLTQPTIGDLVQHVRQLEHDRDSLEKEVADGKTQITELLHTENGVILCGAWSHWPGSSYLQGRHTRSTDVHYSFQHPYASTPTVSLGMVELDAGDGGSRYMAELRSVTTRGFTVRCHVWNTSHIYQMGVSFVSVAKK